HANQRKTHTLTDNQSENVTRLSSQRDANTNLLRALRHRIVDHSKNPHYRQTQRQRSEDGEQQHVETLSAYRIGEYLFHRRDCDRLILIDSHHLLAGGRGQHQRVARTADHHRQGTRGLLEIRQVHFRVWLCVQAAVMNVSHDAHYRQPGTGDDTDSLAERIVIGKVHSRHSFVDDNCRSRLRLVVMLRIRLLLKKPHHWKRDPGVRLRKVSPSLQRDSHNPEVLRVDAAHRRSGLLTGRGSRTAFDRKERPVITRTQRGLSRRAHCFYAGQRFEPFDEIAVEAYLLLRLCVSRSREQEIQPQNIVRVEARINVNQPD